MKHRRIFTAIWKQTERVIEAALESDSAVVVECPRADDKGDRLVDELLETRRVGIQGDLLDAVEAGVDLTITSCTSPCSFLCKVFVS